MNGKNGRRNLKILVVMLTLLLSVVATSGLHAQQSTQHTVQRGETLVILASRYGTTWQAIASLNNLTNPNRIYAGQVLLIPAPSRPQIVGTYAVKAGDTLYALAQRYGTTVDNFVAVNAITETTRLSIGQILNVPASTVPSQPQVPTTPSVPTPNPVTPPAAGSYYFVQYGDTMYRIAARYGVNVYDLAEANGILNLNRIYAGQILRIPGR